MSYALASTFNPLKDLPSFPIFQDVKTEVLRELMATAHTAHFQKGAIILPIGDTISRTYFMLEGWCGACKGNVEGQEAILQIYRRGDFLFESSIDDAPTISLTNFQALTQVHLLTLAPGAVREATKHSPTFSSNLLQALTRQSQDLRNHIEHLTLHNAEQRVGRFLLQLRFGGNPENLDIVLPFDKSLIASYLGIKPETLSRVFQNFRQRGFVIDRSTLIMPSARALCKYCDKIAMRSCLFADSEDCPVAAKSASANTSD